MAIHIVKYTFPHGSGGRYHHKQGLTADYTINSIPLLITANPNTIVYGDEPGNAYASFEGFVSGETESDLYGTIDFVYDYSQFDGVGSYTISPAGVTSNNYDITFADGILTVTEKEIGIEWSGTEHVYDGASYAPAAAATGLVNGDSCNITVTGAGKNAGGYTASAAAIDNDNYILPADRTAAFEILKAPLTVTANASFVTYGDVPENAGVSCAGFAEGEDLTSLTGALAFTYGCAQYGAVGEYSITPSGLTSENYNITYADGILTVGAKEISIEWAGTAFTYDAQEHMPSAAAEGLVNGDICVLTVGGAQKDAGAYTASVTALSNGNYKLPADVTAAFEIARAALTVRANDTAAVYGEAGTDNGVVYEGLAAGETGAVLDGTLLYSIGYSRYGDIGEYVITPSGLTSGNYSITFANGKLTVSALKVSVTINDQSSVIGEAEKELTYSITSGEFFGNDADALKLTRAAGTEPGAYAITGTFSNANYSVEITDGVYKILQKIANDEHNTGVEIISENGLEPGTVLVVTVLDTKDYSGTDLHGAAGGNRRIGKVFEITLEYEGVKVQPNGKIEIRLPVPDEMKEDKNLAVVYIGEDGKAVNMNAVRDGDYMVFEVDHLSVYAIVITGNQSTVIAVSAAAVLLLGIITLGAVLISKKRKKNRG